MKVAEFRQEGDLEALKAAWTRLFDASSSTAIFLSWEWTAAWWPAYGTPGELCILVAAGEDGTVRGIAPLRMQIKRRSGQSVATLTFLADGSNDSDYLDFLIEDGFERDVMAAFSAYLAEELERGTVLLLNEIPENSRTLPFFKSLAEARGLLWMESDVPCATVRLPATWDEYLAQLKPRFRTKVRSVLRFLESRPEIQYRFCKTPQQAEWLLPQLFDLHTRRWSADGKPGVFGWERKRKFYEALSARFLQHGWLRFSWLEWRGRILACQYGFICAGTYSQLQEGYEPDSEHWNVGVGLRAWTIRQFIAEGVREYDFLGGVGRHKTDWGSEVKQSKQVLIARESYKNRLFCHGPQWQNSAKEAARKLVPEKILAIRHARVTQGANGNGTAAHGSGWMREALAECYFRSHMSGLTRRVGDQHRLSIGGGSRWPKLSWQRRNEATGRILYYHRVNDDNDPFFPAMSTRLFDQLMRFVSRHYKVVPLAEMITRMESGNPEQLMAITFDDGYQDNYTQALPILERYGLPATIFLTTGPIDTREPLWFERLALALKKTEREFIELEFDIPRRLWTRTQAERLEANNRLTAILRACRDDQRREWIEEILGQLAVKDEERHGKMLTWDQVRLMKTRGIDFGGHTVSHPYMSRLTSAQAGWEVSECKRRIEVELEMPVAHFAYPNGREEDFAPSNKDLLREAGYQAAVTTIWGQNQRSTDRMALRRGGPWEENAALFAYKLDWYELVDA